MKQAMRTGDEVPTAVKGKTQRDFIPITYIELLPELINGGFIVLVHWYLSGPHFPDGTMPTFDATTMLGIQITRQKIVTHSNARSKV